MPVGVTGGVYRDMWVYAESHEGKFVPCALEMLGEARRLMDKYNRDYNEQERVVAVVIGKNAEGLAKEAIERGADLAVYADAPELEHFRLGPYTQTYVQMARAKAEWKTYDKPRYALFPATNNGRDLSATTMAELDSGVASDCNKLYIEDVVINHPFKTGGAKEKPFPRILHMKRPDFSGFEWSTILCIDAPNRDFHPQTCSVIPGSFQPVDRKPNPKGKIARFTATLTPQDLRVKVRSRRPAAKGIDLTKKDAVVALGRGIGENPTRGFELGLELSRVLDADLGLSRGVITASYSVSPAISQYLAEERQIGETGQTVKPKVYVALGISGAIQHKKGMDKSQFIVTVNTDENVPIREFSDVFVKGDLFQVVPRLVQILEKTKEAK
jgi:electron transfer flavoprotein alpha subunit